jgi:hypothetical protein
MLVQGNVGIGTSAPAVILDVSGQVKMSYNGTRQLSILNPSTSTALQNPSEIYFDRSASASTQTAAVGIDGSTSRNFFVWVNGSDRLNINTAGNVGIGTTSPSYSLQVNGGISATALSNTVLANCSMTANTGSIVGVGWTLFDSWGCVYTGTTTQPFQIKSSALMVGTLVAGGASYTAGSIYATNGTIQTSDSNEKIMQPLAYGLDDLMKVNPIKYQWKTQQELPDDDRNKYHEYFGVVADELDAIFPELVYNQERPFMINYSELIPVCINAIKELKDRNDMLEGRIAQLEQIISLQK